jgi:hypothetical protein
VQTWRAITHTTLGVVNFFASLKSNRRLALLTEVDISVRKQIDAKRQADDPFRVHKQLDDFALYAADGHYHAASAHDARNRDGNKQAVGHFFALNMRTHTMRHLDVARPKRKREHDITALKRFGTRQLRMGEANGRKVLFVYDRAIIDFVYWIALKAAGVYVVSRERENMKLMITGIKRWDASDPCNVGVIADELVGAFCGHIIRRVRFKYPLTGEEFSFLTTEFTLPPGLIALLYLHRWDLEKVFDEFKNKLFETKAWASSNNAKCQHTIFCCLAHNLMLLMEFNLDKDHGITEKKLADKRRKRKDLVASLNPNLVMPATIDRITQRSFQFIRWLRHHLDFKTPWLDALDDLRPLMEAYLS